MTLLVFASFVLVYVPQRLLWGTRLNTFHALPDNRNGIAGVRCSALSTSTSLYTSFCIVRYRISVGSIKTWRVIFLYLFIFMFIEVNTYLNYKRISPDRLSEPDCDTNSTKTLKQITPLALHRRRELLSGKN